MTQSAIKLEFTDNIAIMTLDNPPVNALTQEIFKELTMKFNELSFKKGIDVVILTGAGEKAFMAGNDLNEFATMTPENAVERMKVIRECFWAIYDCEIPVICAVNGHAVGGGLVIASCSDVIFASENATFGLPEINVGVMGGSKFLMRMVPQHKVREMFLSGKSISAREGYEVGFVKTVTSRENLLNESLVFARELASKTPIGLRFAKKSMNLVEYLHLKEGYEMEQQFTIQLSGYDDSKEAVKAFFEKREPKFRGV